MQKMEMLFLGTKLSAAENRSRFMRNNIVVFFGAMICCALWGSAYPTVKMGMQLVNITSEQMADQVLFAGIRFTLAGFFVILFGSISKKRVLIPHGVQHAKIWKLSFFQTIMQYSFYYIGLAHATGVNTSIVDSTSYFLAILSACFVFRLEKLSTRKVIGCILGFVGVIIVNIGSGSVDMHMSFIGEGMVFISACAYSISSVLAKIYSQGDDPVLLSGWQFMAGGAVLIAGSIICGGRLHEFSPLAVAVLIYLSLVSTMAYTLWSVLLKYNDVSKVSIFGFMNPIFGVLFSLIILGETQALSINCLAALLLISIGIALVNGKENSMPEKQ